MKVSRFFLAAAMAVAMALGAPGIAAGDTGAQVITEDSALWDCRIHGNRVCGAGSGYPPGRYDRGALVAPWAITPAGLETDTGEYVGGYN